MIAHYCGSVGFNKKKKQQKQHKLENNLPNNNDICCVFNTNCADSLGSDGNGTKIECEQETEGRWGERKSAVIQTAK